MPVDIFDITRGSKAHPPARALHRVFFFIHKEYSGRGLSLCLIRQSSLKLAIKKVGSHPNLLFPLVKIFFLYIVSQRNDILVK